MRKLTPIETKSLIATGNALRLKQSENQFVRIPATNMNWVNDYDLGISFCFCLNSITSNNNFLFERRILHSESVDGYYCFIQPIDSNRGYLKFGIYEGIIESLDSLIIEVGRMYRVTVNISDNIYIKLNNGKTFVQPRSSHVLDPGLLNHLSIDVDDDFSNGHDKTADCLISNLVFIKGSFSESEIAFLHNNNILPESVHPKVIAHYPLNQNSGDKAFDVVEQYNYVQALPLQAVHGELHNYSSDETGSINVLTQTAWLNFYSRVKDGKYFFKGDGTNLYATVPSFTNQLFPSGFCLYVDLIIPENSLSLECLFVNQIDAVDESNFVMVFYNGANNTLVLYTGSYTTGIVAVNPGQRYKLLITSNEMNNVINTYLNETLVWSRTGSPNTFVAFTFLGQPPIGRYYSGGISKAVLINTSVSSASREFSLLFKSNKSDEYKNIPGIQFDIDFGSVYTNNGVWYAKDLSANHRDALLNGINLSDHQPIYLNAKTDLPERIKALRFIRTSSHYVKVSNFNPTKEKGYTHIIAFSVVDNDDNTVNLFFEKRNLYGPVWAKGMSKGYPINHSILTYDQVPGNTGFNYYYSSKNNLQKTNYVAFTSSFHPVITSQLRIFTQQNASIIIDQSTGGSSDTITGYDEFDNDPLYIGMNPNANQPLDGYISFLGIWKGVLSEVEILSIMNNTLGANADSKLMVDCQLYLNFEEIHVNGSIYSLKDWSPQNHDVTLHNYALAEITPGDVSYRLVDVDKLR